MYEMVNLHRVLRLMLYIAGWKVRCAEYFPYSTYFEGSRSSASPNSVLNQIYENSENGNPNHSVDGQNVDSITSNGKLEAFKKLTI